MRFSIRSKIATASVVVVLLVGAMIGASLVVGRNAQELMAKLRSYDEKHSLVQDLKLHIADVWQFLTDASLTRNRDAIDQDAKKAFDQANTDIASLVAIEQDQHDRESMKAFNAVLLDFWASGSAMFDAYGKGKGAGDALMALDAGFVTHEARPRNCGPRGDQSGSGGTRINQPGEATANAKPQHECDHSPRFHTQARHL